MKTNRIKTNRVRILQVVLDLLKGDFYSAYSWQLLPSKSIRYTTVLPATRKWVPTNYTIIPVLLILANYRRSNLKRLVLQLFMPNPLKRDAKWGMKMKMELEQHRQSMLQLYLSDKRVYCLLRCGLYSSFDGNYAWISLRLWTIKSKAQQKSNSLYTNCIYIHGLSIHSSICMVKAMQDELAMGCYVKIWETQRP